MSEWNFFDFAGKEHPLRTVRKQSGQMLALAPVPRVRAAPTAGGQRQVRDIVDTRRAAVSRTRWTETRSTCSRPTLVIAGLRDALINQDRVHVLTALPYVEAVRVPGAHALNYSRPALFADLIEAFLAGVQLVDVIARHPGVEEVDAA